MASSVGDAIIFPHMRCESCKAKRKEEVFERFYHEISSIEELKYKGVHVIVRSSMVRKAVEDVKKCVARCFVDKV